LQVDSKLSEGLYKRIGEDTTYLKKSIRAELSRGASNGESWNQIAARIAFGMNRPLNKAYNNSIRIARTEGHRVQQEAAFHCQQRAKSKGADVVKQWCSTLDSKTRHNHIELDNQVREMEEPFEVAGKKAMYPGAFGDPAEDCNCRCCILQRARWALSEEEFITKWDGNKKELVKIHAKSYDEFKRKVNSHLMNMQFPVDIYRVKGVTDDVGAELETALKKLKSEYEIKLDSIVVEKTGQRDIFVTGYHNGAVSLVVNENADFDEIIKKMKGRYETGHFAGKTLEDYLAHEMAHVMLYQNCETDAEYLAKYDQVETLYDSLKGISKYADKKESGNEALAEAFVRVRNKEEVSQIARVLV